MCAQKTETSTDRTASKKCNGPVINTIPFTLHVSSRYPNDNLFIMLMYLFVPLCVHARERGIACELHGTRMEV